jgi:hypothetical protein
MRQQANKAQARKPDVRAQARVHDGFGIDSYDSSHSFGQAFDKPGFKTRRNVPFAALLFMAAASGAFVFGLVRELFL